MPPSVVLVTGAGQHLGARLISRLSSDRAVKRVIGVDLVPPSAEIRGLLGAAEFIRLDIRNSEVAKIISSTKVDTVIHTSVTAHPHGVRAWGSMKELNVLGTMQLLAACQKSPTVQRLVIKSSTAVYGASSRDPALFTEDTAPSRVPDSGYGKDSVEIEGYVRGFSRRRPDVALSILRFAAVVGPGVQSPLSQYLSLPVVPTALGYDPRIQLLHEDDAVEVLYLASHSRPLDVVNVAGDGVLFLSQAIRRAGRVPAPIPSLAANTFGSFFRRIGLIDISTEQLQTLNLGRVVDTTRLREQVGYLPQYNTAEAFADAIPNIARQIFSVERIVRVEQFAVDFLTNNRSGAGSLLAQPNGSPSRKEPSHV